MKKHQTITGAKVPALNPVVWVCSCLMGTIVMCHAQVNPKLVSRVSGSSASDVILPPSKVSVINSKSLASSYKQSKYPWRKGIIATVFWIGEQPSKNNPVPNDKSSWDTKWKENYGGLDTPVSNRRCSSAFTPEDFTPMQNPFYIALPYNDISKNGTKQEAALVIPWFRAAFEKNGQSVLKGRWVAVKNPSNGKVCFAQWEDVGPFRTDHWQYVFGRERPSPNINGGAGIDISPAVRDYLEVGSKALVDWRFCEFYEVANGPWRNHGKNNIFVSYKKMMEQVSSDYP